METIKQKVDVFFHTPSFKDMLDMLDIMDGLVLATEGQYGCVSLPSGAAFKAYHVLRNMGFVSRMEPNINRLGDPLIYDLMGGNESKVKQYHDMIDEGYGPIYVLTSMGILSDMEERP